MPAPGECGRKCQFRRFDWVLAGLLADLDAKLQRGWHASLAAQADLGTID